jgi:TnpA family transposase
LARNLTEPLCALRYLGFAPDDLRIAPREAVVYVARQLGIPPEALATYGRRIPTRTMHLQQVQAYLGSRPQPCENLR